ncbi:MAG TPA: anthranilate phosphoribosyltransferase [Thermoleophilaceae bacterium]|nr:anthranilate phosphoribosyltransferase [Thermoleophilaceae bacterium]
MPNPMLTEAIDRLCRSEALTADEATAVLREVMAGRASEAQTAGLLIAFRTKGETVPEIAGMARAMREVAVAVQPAADLLVDTAGTGGGRPTFNVSTTAAFVAAGAGCRVAKHGNRSATGRSGSADVLEALGARIDLDPGAVAACIDELGFGFMYAPSHHPAMRHVVPVRKELAVRTVFNFLGPLTNPAGATRQLIGVSDRRFLDIVAGALAELGCDHALVVSSDDGLDELSVSGPTRMVELRDGHILANEISPESVGLSSAPQDAVAAGTPEKNAGIARRVLQGAQGAERDLTALNAGAAIYVGGGADSIEAGVRRAEDAIDSGAARDVLERFVARTRELAA